MRLTVIIPLGPDEVEWHGLVPQLSTTLPRGSEVVIVAAKSAVTKPPADWPKQLALNHFGVAARRARFFAALGGFREDARYGDDHLLAWAARRAGLPLRGPRSCCP